MNNNNQINYALWRRVSTQEQGRSGLGLDAQLTIARHFYGEPQKIFTDVYSGTRLRECKELQKAKAYCKQHNLPLVVAKCDRVRNVIQGLELLDDLGESNLIFCDVGRVDRTILTMMFAIYERQAIMGKINTRIALAERKRQASDQGFWISKAGNVCTALGSKKGADLRRANAASAAVRSTAAREWQENSQAVKYAKRRHAEGASYDKIWLELSHLYNDWHGEGLNPFGTPRGAKVGKGHLSIWLRKEIK